MTTALHARLCAPAYAPRPSLCAEPFDGDMWMLVAIGAVHTAALAIFVFEWATPDDFVGAVSACGVRPPSMSASRPPAPVMEAPAGCLES